jgi:homoserine O-acetyltransferase
MSLKVYKHDSSFELELGEKIDGLEIAYHTFGELNKDKTNVVWVFHALTANSNVMEWWPGLFGENDLFNPRDYFIVCANVLGSPYGTTSPKDLNFPRFTVRDVVQAQLLLTKQLGIESIYVAIGGSFGGNQAVEFAYSYAGNIENLILLACSAVESAWSISIHEAQRLAIKADTTFGQPNGGKAGLKAARGIALLTYRTSAAYIEKQTDTDERTDDFKASSYIQYQGDKLVSRFDAISFYYLLKCLDSHNIGRGRGNVKNALNSIKTNALLIALDTDFLIPPALTKAMGEHIPSSVYREIESAFGHDGFLIETEKISKVISNFLTLNR